MSLLLLKENLVLTFLSFLKALFMIYGTQSSSNLRKSIAAQHTFEAYIGSVLTKKLSLVEKL